MSSWDDKKQIIVSITCVAYNQEYCISETLDSFLMQETSFPFEVLINDDASTDKTAEIIQGYEDKFPNIVKPVYQSENQFSQGFNTIFPLFPKAKGRYVAICDGDDYWDDKKKLEIQVDAMEKHLDVDLSFHPAKILKEGQIESVMSRHTDKDKIFAPEEVILGRGGFCPTESLMLRKKVISPMPDWTKKIILGDYVLQLMGAKNGGALYIDRCMTIHRIGNEGSWTNSVYSSAKNSEIRKKSLLSLIELLYLFNNYYDKKFEKVFDKAIHNEALYYITNIALDVSPRKEIYNLYKTGFSKKQKMLWHLLYSNKIVFNIFKWIKLTLFKDQRNGLIRKPLGKIRKFLMS